MHRGLQRPVLNEARGLGWGRGPVRWGIPGPGSLCHIPELPGPASAGPDQLLGSTAGKKTEEASSVPSHPRATSTPPPLRERHPWNRAGAPPGDLWAPARTKAGPKTPRHHAHVSTHSHIHAQIHAPSGAHSDVPRDSRSIYKLNYSPWFAYIDHLCARAT